jgi:hypothetical protein
MISTTIPIQGTFDIAKGRNSLRAHIAAQHWSPTFGARAAAALTALGELILQANKHNLVIVRMNVFEEGNEIGVQFTCTIQIPEGESAGLRQAEDRLSRAADQLEMQEIAHSVQITAGVWQAAAV